MNYENIIFLQESQAHEAMEIYYNEGEEALLTYLKQWHFPGEGEFTECIGNGTQDKIFHFGRYKLIVNTYLGYCGLVYEHH